MGKNFHTDNKSFMLYKDWEDIFQALDSDEVGEVVMALFAFAKRGESPELKGGAKIAFLMMRNALERDGHAWEEACEQRSERARKGAKAKHSKAEKGAEENDVKEEAEQASTSTHKQPQARSASSNLLAGTDIDTDTVTDKEKDTDIDIEKDEETDKETAKSANIAYGGHKNVFLTSEQHAELSEKCLSVGLSIESYISKLSDWLYKNGKKCTDPFGVISGWISNDAKKGKADRPKSELSWYEDYALDFDLSDRL